MSNPGYSLKRVQVSINGRPVVGLKGASDPNSVGQEPGRQMAGAHRATGFDDYDSNVIDYTFTVAAGEDDHYYDQFIDGPLELRKVDLAATYEDTSDFKDGAYTGLVSTEGRLSRAARAQGDELGDRSYTFHGIGFTRTYKNRPNIVKV